MPADPTLEQLAQDWIALWQSELQALVADPTIVGRMAKLAGAARPDAAPGPASAAVPPRDDRDPGGGGEPVAADWRARERVLLDRIAALEQRLATLEGGPSGGEPHRPGPRRKRPKA